MLFPDGRSDGWIIERRDDLAGFRRHKCVGIFCGLGCRQNVLDGFERQTLDSVTAKELGKNGMNKTVGIFAIDSWLGVLGGSSRLMETYDFSEALDI